MATRSPNSITVNDDDPQTGFITIFLDTPGLKVKKPLIGKARPENDADNVDVQINDTNVAVTIDIQGGKCYEYKKNLPEDVDKSKSSYELKKDAVVLRLKKKDAQSWTAHVRYLMTRE